MNIQLVYSIFLGFAILEFIVGIACLVMYSIIIGFSKDIVNEKVPSLPFLIVAVGILAAVIAVAVKP